MARKSLDAVQKLAKREYDRKRRQERGDALRAYDRGRYAADPERRTRAAEARRKSKLNTKFGLTLEQYDEMVRKQNGVCAICLYPEVAARPHHPSEIDTQAKKSKKSRRNFQ